MKKWSVNTSVLRSTTGLTLVELVITGLIVSAVAIGLMTSFVTLNKHYKLDYLETNLIRYADLALDEITTDLHQARWVCIDRYYGGMSQITMGLPTNQGTVTRVVYTANNSAGITVNNEPIPRPETSGGDISHASFLFPNFGMYLNNEDWGVSLEEFEVVAWDGRDTGVTQLGRKNENFVVIRINLALIIDQETDVKQNYEFTRRVFVDRSVIPGNAVPC